MINKQIAKNSYIHTIQNLFSKPSGLSTSLSKSLNKLQINKDKFFTQETRKINFDGNSMVSNYHIAKPIYLIAIQFLLMSIIFFILGLGINEVLADPRGVDAFKLRLDSGIYVDSGENTPFVDFVQRLIGIFLQNLLPIASILFFLGILLTMVATIAYLMRQDIWDEVYMAKLAYKAEKTQGGSPMLNSLKNRSIASSNALQTYGFVKCILAPNLKSIAFFDASQNHMTVADFFKVNGIQYILAMAFAIMISNQTLLDGFYTAGRIGTYFVEKAVYDFDYVSILDGIMTTGTDFKPTWATNTVDGKNKTKAYQVAYKLLKTGCTNKATRTGAFKETMGRQLMQTIENMREVEWDRKAFTVSAELLPQTAFVKTIPGESYYFDVSNFGFTSGVSDSISGLLHISIVSEEETFNSGVVKTLYPAAWTVSGNSARFDVTKIYNDPDAKVSKVVSKGTATYSKVGNISIDVRQEGTNIVMSWNPPADAGELRSLIFTGLQITGKSGTKKDFAQITYKK